MRPAILAARLMRTAAVVAPLARATRVAPAARAWAAAPLARAFSAAGGPTLEEAAKALMTLREAPDNSVKLRL
jgi:hypothetical protein